MTELRDRMIGIMRAVMFAADMEDRSEEGDARIAETAANDALALLPSDGWRDIESAPRDGTRILAITKYGVETVVYREEQYSPDVMGDQAHGRKSGWWGVEQDSDCKPEFHSVIRGIVSASHQPTKWRPLPQLPAQSEATND